jgi:hypothetical protein
VSVTKTGLFDGRQNFRKRRNVAAREDVFGDPRIGDVRRTAAADRVQQNDAVVGEEFCAFLEEGVVEADADVLEHPDRDDAVEAAPDIAIVDQLKFRAVRLAALHGALLRALMLLARQRDAGDVRAGEFR